MRKGWLESDWAVRLTSMTLCTDWSVVDVYSTATTSSLALLSSTLPGGWCNKGKKRNYIT
jgi:hypothetical protein